MVFRRTKWTGFPGFLFILLLIWSESLLAEEFSFTASVDRTAVELDEELRLTVSVSGTGIRGVGEPKLPSLEDFDVLGRSSSQSSQFSIVNGRMSSKRTIDYVYTLRPRRTGTLRIGSAEVTFKGASYRTDPIEIVVGGPSPRQQLPPEKPASTPNKKIFLDARADKTTAYVGEQITVSYSLYVAVNLSNVRLGNLPSYSGFWSEEVFSAKRLDFKTRVIGGTRYDVAPIKRVALFATTSGAFEIDPMSIVCDVPVRTGDYFRDFWGATRTVTVKSSPIQIKVIPLPGEGRHPEFAGAVGSFSFSVEASSQVGRVGEPVEITVTVSGRGNVRTLEVPRLPDLQEFKVYEPEVSLDVSRSGNHISGTKTLKYMVVPNSQGKHIVPGLKFSFFDPEDEKYHLVTTEEIVLDIRAGGVADVSGPGGVRGPVEILGTDILYIKPDLRSIRIGADPLYRNFAFQALQTLPVLALLLVFLYQKHRQRMEGDLAYARSRRARSLASARLRSANALLRKGEFASVPSEIAKAVTEYVGDRMNLPTPGLTLDVIVNELRSKGVSEEVLRMFKMCMDRCDLARFAASGVDEPSATEMLELAGRLIERLEKARLR